MRYVLVFMILMLGFGAVLQTMNNPAAATVDVVMLGDVSGGKQLTDRTLSVDRADDPATLLDCTEADNDCTLRSAITWANQDHVPTTINFTDHFNIVLNAPLPHFTEEKTVVFAAPDQEVHVNGNGIPGALLQIVAADVRIEGLRLYGAGAGHANIAILGGAHSVTIADNIIGDNDAPAGDCQPQNQSYSGITVDSVSVPEKVTAWIHGNIIECLAGTPAIGILVQTNNVIIGKDSLGRATEAQRNVVRLNQGYGIYVGDQSGNTICNNLLHDNRQGGLFITNFNNNIVDNRILDATAGQAS